MGRGSSASTLLFSLSNKYSTMVTDWKERARNHLAKRDASIPKQYLVDLVSHGIKSAQEFKEEIPRPVDPKAVYKPDAAISASIYPSDTVIDVPRDILDMQDVVRLMASLAF